MTHIIPVDADDRIAAFLTMKGAESLVDRAQYARHAPDLSMMAVATSGDVEARCSLWWNRVPDLPGWRLCVLGHYAAVSDKAARNVLDEACRTALEHGCTAVVGPMDGTTWNRYRLVVERGSEPAFFLEPENPEEWPDHFRAAGFETLASYSSALTENLAVEDAAVARAERRLLDSGVTIRTLDPGRFERELHNIYTVSCVAFQKNFLYTPIEEAEFAGQYKKIQPFVRPEFVELAELEGQCVGYLFAIPDLNAARRGAAVDTLIVKTVAVLPGRKIAGLGNVLVARSHAAARRSGMRRVVHALMHDANNSRNLSGRYASAMRRYDLFWKTLA